MLNKVFRVAIFATFSFLLVATTYFTGESIAIAGQMSSDTSVDNTLGIVIEESKESPDNTKTSSMPDLGDDQAFPFIPGFGKNSGKD
tara:strand:+ start:608 stop:868 length:261 start_codon:yes stop_codon:yes gene_type:complete